MWEETGTSAMRSEPCGKGLGHVGWGLEYTGWGLGHKDKGLAHVGKIWLVWDGFLERWGGF